MTAMYDTAKQFNRILYWDDDNRLTKTVDTTSGASVSTQYHYDAKGMRIVKEGPYGKSIYIDTGYVESGAPQTAPIVSNHIFVGNTRVASVVKHTEEKNPATYYYASDHLGSSSVLTTNTGRYHERIEYLPYGEVWVEDKATSDGYSTPYKFTGKELDTETGLYYFGARYYDAKISRWISTDPALHEGKYFPKPNDYDTEHDFYWYLQQDGSKKLAGLGGVFNAVNMDVYHYAGNNPVKLVDPDGNDIILLNKSKGAIGHGHNGVLIGNDKNGWFYFSKDGAGKLNQNAKYFKSLNDFIKSNLKDNNGLNNYDRAYRVETSEDDDSKMIEEGFNIYDRDYSIVENLDNASNTISQNCADLVADILEFIGLNIGKPKMDTPVGDVTKPNYQFENFIKSNKGELIDILRQLPPKG